MAGLRVTYLGTVQFLSTVHTAAGKGLMMPERKSSSEQRNLPEVSIISRVFTICLSLCCMCHGVSVEVGTIFRSQFSPSTMWVLRL